MTRILIFSDNHRDRKILNMILSFPPKPDFLFSLGDSEMPEHELSNLGIVGVRGNYPFEPDYPADLVLCFSGIRFLFTHGHNYHVKTGTGILLEKAISEDINVVFYGHTHLAKIEYRDDVLLVNPGALAYAKGPYGKTYALAELDEGRINVMIKNAMNGETILEKQVAFESGDPVGNCR